MRQTLKNILFIFILTFGAGFNYPAQSAPVAGALSCGRVFQSRVVTVDQLLQGNTRPKAQDVLSLSQRDRDSLARRDINPSNGENPIFQAMAEVAKEVINKWDGRPVILLGRDSELIFDTLQYLFIASNTPASVTDRAFLLTLSRPMIENSNYGQIRNYVFRNTGVDLNEVMSGRQSVRIFDTGNRGSIYLKVLQLILGQVKNKDPEWKSKILNSLRNIDFVLLASEESGSLNKVIKKIDAMKEFDRAEILELFDKENDFLYFRQLSVPGAEKKNLIPKGLDERYQWVVDNIEYRPHWEGRTLGLTKNGKDRLYPLENDPRVNKQGYLSRQIQLFNYLESAADVQAIVDLFAERSGNKSHSKSKAKKGQQTKLGQIEPSNILERQEPKEKVKPDPDLQTLIPQAGLKLQVGQVVELEKKRYRVESELGSGQRGRVYKVVDLQNQRAFALKIAKYNDEETLDSFRRESSKQQAYQRAGVPFAAILKQDAMWILKEIIEGERADDWLDSWNADQNPQGGSHLRNLVKLLVTIANQGMYIGDLNPTNLIWKDDRWVIIDSGDASYDYSPRKSRKRFYEKNLDRWNDYFPTEQKRKIFKKVLKDGLVSQNFVFSRQSPKVA